ncbi:MAG: protein kinase [Planctomycetota bacterium]|nr:protein kinase [Planctomycetota bacterium]
MTDTPFYLDIPTLGPDPIALSGKNRWVLGSDPQRADLVLPGLEVAPVHCVLTVSGSQIQVTDLGSDAGTLIEGNPVSQGHLGPGQRMDVGPVSVWLSESGSNGGELLPEIPGYEIEREVGRGAGGHVYLAVQTSLQRQVAIKVLAPALSHDPELVQRFESEARAAAALGHSNVVTVFDVGSHGKVHYLSMEYMGEGSLADRLDNRGPLSWRQTLRMMADACKALAFAESRGLVHRDIKPANLMLTETGVTKLADLGLVMDLSQDHGSGPAMGTPHFLAPEVVRGQKPSPVSDLYSLGATAYQVATGETPYQGSSSKEILRAALKTEAESPSALDPEIPEPVSQLILDLMAKEPGMRPQNAQQVLERIDRLELQLGLPAEGASSGKRRWALLLAGPALLAAAYFLWDGSEDKPDVPTVPGVATSDGHEGAEPNPVQSGESDPEPESFEFNEVTNGAEGESRPADMGAEFETQAQEGLKKILEQDLADPERILKLREFAQTFRGSNSADEALTQAGSLEERARSLIRAAERAEEMLGDEVEILRELGKWVPEERPILDPLQSMLTYETALAGDNGIRFEEQRKKLLLELLGQGDAFLQETLRTARNHGSKGAFDEATSVLSAQVDRFAPTVPVDLNVLNESGQAPAEVLEFRSSVQELSILLAGLPEQQSQWQALTRTQDREVLGSQLGRASELKRELSSFLLADARKRIQETQARLRSEPGKGWAAALDRDLALMEDYLAAWRSAYKTGDWDNKNTLDPRAARPSNVLVTGVHTDWVSLAGDRIPFADFLVRERDFRFLFDGRVKSALTPDQREGQATLYRLQAVLSVLDQVQEMLVSNGGARFNEGEAESVRVTLERAQEGQTTLGLAALRVEQETAEVLVAGLRAYSLKDYGAAAGYMERAFQVGSGSLLLLLLSDGELLPLDGQTPSPAASEGE